jgi:hypothetical protein
MARFVSVIYCDDIRNEVGNKQSFIGVYRTNLYVPKFPAALPKLCVVISVQTNKNEPFTSLKYRLLNIDAQIAEAVVPPEALVPHTEEASSDPSADGYIVCTLALVLAPFKIEAAMRLRVRVDADGEELKGPALIIDQAPEQIPEQAQQVAR